jgi:hypothetical protein
MFGHPPPHDIESFAEHGLIASRSPPQLYLRSSDHKRRCGLSVGREHAAGTNQEIAGLWASGLPAGAVRRYRRDKSPPGVGLFLPIAGRQAKEDFAAGMHQHRGEVPRDGACLRRELFRRRNSARA